MANEKKEQRKAPRIKREVVVQYSIRELPLDGLQVARQAPADMTRTRDLAEKGLFFTASRMIPLDSILDIQLRLPTQQQYIFLQGRVVGCEEARKDFIYKVRVEFVNLDEQDKQTLAKFVQLFLRG